MIDLEERLNALPDLPGVYLMKDKNQNIIYVGKAKSLKNRVRQYFRGYGKSNIKVKSMVNNIDDFEYIIVRNEVESLILESNLIKDNNPKYNILLRDDKQYPYIKITNESYPRVKKVRKIKKDGAKYFGPYPAVTSVNNAIEIFENLYPLRNCNLNLNKDIGRNRPCLNYFIGKCLAPCQANVDENLYNQMIKEIEDFLEGKNKLIIEQLKLKMIEKSKELKFEEAAKIRDYINSLNVLLERQLITNTDTKDNRDIIGIARGIDEVLIQVFFVRDGKIIGREHYFMNDFLNSDNEQIIKAFIKQFYLGASFIPREILIEEEISEKELLEEFLSKKRGLKVNILIPQKGDKKALIKMVKTNALDMLTKYGDKYKRRAEKNRDILIQIKNLLNLEKIPYRIESFDISNTYGIESVGSMVVFENGESKKSDYRKFKIKTVNGPNDYASMKEVLKRRFKRGMEEKSNNIISSFSNFPDLIMMDGGKGQVNIALEVLKELNINIAICGLVKDDKHKTRGIIYNNIEYNVNVSSDIYRMIYKIQEEAHRFAINYHRSLRSKSIFSSELDNIDFIGPKRKSELMKYFKSIDKIKKASIDELSFIKSMNKKAAISLYNHFNGGEDEKKC